MRRGVSRRARRAWNTGCVIPVTPADEARFWSKVDKNGPVHPVLGTRCWLWTASVMWRGYFAEKADAAVIAKRNELYTHNELDRSA